MKTYCCSFQKWISLTATGFVLFLLSSCANQTRIHKTSLNKHLNSSRFQSQMTGLLVYNPDRKDTLVQYHANQYFIPASNTKIFTLYTALRILPEKMPLLKTYQISKDSLLIIPMGDPTPFHPYFKDSSILKIMAPYEHIGFETNRLEDQPFGPGWAWEDFDSYYAPERSALPLYGNVLEVQHLDSVPYVNPSFFESNIYPKDPSQSFSRAAHSNLFYISKEDQDNEIPFKTSDSLTIDLLRALSGKNVFAYSKPQKLETSIIFGISRDSVLKVMMKESDNFLAEQLLINASAYLTDTLSIKPAQKFVLDGALKDLQQYPRWVDGSGLSRYNLMSPVSVVQVLEKLYQSEGLDRLKLFFPWGGENGTLKNWFSGQSEPYIFAKTGSLGNTYCLSGYLITKKGKTLIFSYMNNHFTRPSTEVKKDMQEVLEAIRDQN